MKLGEFKKLTENLSDDIDIILSYGEVVDIPMAVSLKDKSDVGLEEEFLDEYSDKIICVYAEPPEDY